MSLISDLVAKVCMQYSLSGRDDTLIHMTIGEVRTIIQYYSNWVSTLEVENKRLKALIEKHGEGPEFDWGVLDELGRLQDENEELRKAVDKLREDDR